MSGSGFTTNRYVALAEAASVVKRRPRAALFRVAEAFLAYLEASGDQWNRRGALMAAVTECRGYTEDELPVRERIDEILAIADEYLVFLDASRPASHAAAACAIRSRPRTSIPSPVAE